MDNIIHSRWKCFAVRFAIFFPILFLSRLLFGAGLLRYILAWSLATWIDPVRRAKAKEQTRRAEIEQAFF